MNTLHSGVENEGLNAHLHPMIGKISKAVLVAITALMAAGCVPDGADIRNTTTECLNNKEKAGEQLKALCVDNKEAVEECLKNAGKEGVEACKDNNTTLKEIVFKDCEVPKAETKIFFLGENTTVGAEHGPVNSGIHYFCKGEEEE